MNLISDSYRNNIIALIIARALMRVDEINALLRRLAQKTRSKVMPKLERKTSLPVFVGDS